MNWQVAVILTGVLSGLAQVAGKKLVMNLGAFQGGVIRDVTTLIFVIGVLMISGGVPTVFDWRVVAIFTFGLLESVSLALYFSAIRTQMAATAVFSYPMSQLLIILFSGIFFAEWRYFDFRHLQGAVNVIALGLTIVLMILYQGKGTQIKGRIKWSNALAFSAIIVALTNIESKWAVTTLAYSPAQAMLYEYLGMLAGGLAYVAYQGQTLRVGWRNVGWGALQGILFGVSSLWYVGLLRDNPIGISSLLRRVTIVLISLTVAFWGYREGKKMKREQVVSLVLGLLIFGLVMWVNR